MVHKNRRAAMLKKAGKTVMQTVSFAKGGEILLQPEETSYFSLGVICRTGNRTIPSPWHKLLSDCLLAGERTVTMRLLVSLF